VSKSATQPEAQDQALPANFLNAYEITNPQELEWRVATYRLARTDGVRQTHEERSDLKGAMWSLYRQHRNRCHGFGFVVDINEHTVAVPEGWDIPSPTTFGPYDVTREREFVAKASDPRSQAVIAGVIREGLKRHFKDNHCEALGDLWQDYDKFCQTPGGTADGEYSMCRRFTVSAKMLRGNRWVVECAVGTTTVDNRTFADYYTAGRVDDLAGMIDLKRAAKVNRRNRPVRVSALRVRKGDFGDEVVAVELEDPATILNHRSLPASKQVSLAGGAVLCKVFPQPPEQISLSELRLILDTQITQDDHSETIIEPEDREHLMRHLREFVNESEVYGRQILLSESPFDADQLPKLFILPPAVRVRGKGDTEEIIAAPAAADEELLRRRAIKRSEHIRRFGYLQRRPINPLLAWPREVAGRPVSEIPGQRMKSDLNKILEAKGIGYRFDLIQYENVEEIRQAIAGEEGYDALLAVLPEGGRAPRRPGSTHEQIKQNMEAPSQCIQYDHTLPSRWVDRPPEELFEKDRRTANRTRQRYELIVLGLLVKHHWIPFAPADAFNFNVQVGLDVGGVHNTDAVSCMGYGFRRPQEELIFRPDEIPIGTGKAEPIPTDNLYEGLLRQFVVMRSQLLESEREADFETVLFYRDGRLLGDGEEWNEREALDRLHSELLRRRWVTESSVWAAVEVMKFAEGWRLMRGGEKVMNPVAGECILLYEDDDMALVTTTGSPYLTQGTACPLMIRVVDINGRAERREVIRDLVWQADMCFTKPDTGMRLPWVLNVADTGALQQSRSYKITGITA
jgi:hypothetical protein